jgi:transcriptional regulator of acetoin/glycerol metabolism
MALAPGPRLRIADLPLAQRAWRRVASPISNELPLSLEAYERCALERALCESGGDAVVAARHLGIGRSTLYRKLAKHDLRRGGGSGRAIG